jgi:hypothetical protein
MSVAGETWSVPVEVDTLIATDAEGMPLATTTSVLAPSSIPLGTVKLVEDAAPGAIDREL